MKDSAIYECRPHTDRLGLCIGWFVCWNVCTLYIVMTVASFFVREQTEAERKLFRCTCYVYCWHDGV